MTFIGKLLLAASIFASSGAAMAAQSYPMVCRGGGSTIGYQGSTKTAYLYFAKAPQRSGLGLGYGQCAWVDRAIGQGEPTCLRQLGVDATAWIFPGNFAGSYFTSDQAPWLRNLLSGNNLQTFQAYNPGDGNCFMVTRLGF